MRLGAEQAAPLNRSPDHATELSLALADSAQSMRTKRESNCKKKPGAHTAHSKQRRAEKTASFTSGLVAA